MARYFDVHPENPQQRTVTQIVDILRADGVIAFPTDTSFALGCRIGNAAGLDRIREIRQLDPKHHFTLICDDFSQMSEFVYISNSAFRAVKAATPGAYTFILPATKEVPRRLQHPKKATVGVRIPGTPLVKAMLDELGEPIVSCTLRLPGDEEPMSQGWEIKERLDHQVEAVVDTEETPGVMSTIVDLSGSEPEVVRVGAGDPSRFE